MKIVKIVSEWKKRPSDEAMRKFGNVGQNEKMVQAIVMEGKQAVTRHIKVPR